MTIRGYPWPPSVAPGDELSLHVSTTAARFHARFFRLGAQLEPAGATAAQPGMDAPDGPPDADWAWPVHPWRVPATWRSGIYLAVLDELAGEEARRGADPPGENPPAVDGRHARLLFVVRRAGDADPAPVLYKVPLATYHAYNASGGGSLYVGQRVGSDGRCRVTLRRPGGGTGGELSFPGAVDVYDAATPREGVAHWDLPFVAWLERAGHAADFCTDLDLHALPGLLAGHSLLLSAGHDEYWSEPTRRAVEQFAARGGNVAFFSGNVCFWRVELDAAGETLSCAHPPVVAEPCDQWWLSRPESGLTGVSYRNGGGWWSGPREPLGYTVTYADHWVFAGSGVEDGDEFGGEERLVGYECDGARIDSVSGDFPRADTRDGTPGDFELLALARLSAGWQDRPAGSAATATLGLYTPGGTVFTAATTDWPRVLAAGHPLVEHVTRRVVEALSAHPAALRAPRHGRAGAEVSLHTEMRPSDGPARIRWWASGGELEAEGASARLQLPANRRRVSVTVEVTGERGRRFGHVTIEVLTGAQAAQLQALRAVRELAVESPPAPVPTLSAHDGNRPVTHPAWDELRDGLRRSLTAEEAAGLRARGLRLAALAARLGEELGADRGSQR